MKRDWIMAQAAQRICARGRISKRMIEPEQREIRLARIVVHASREPRGFTGPARACATRSSRGIVGYHCTSLEGPMSEAKKARMVGFNHVALEVGDIEAALAFYGRLFEFELRSKSDSMAFIDLGDQFLALQKGRKQAADDGRHFGLVVDDKEAVRKALVDAGIETLPGPFLDFRDPWGNRIEIVGYDNIQFTKAPNVLRGMRLAHLSKNETAINELAEKGMAPK